jgi:hypothetical protein
LIQCNETDLVKDLVRFIEDLVACTEGRYNGVDGGKLIYLPTL